MSLTDVDASSWIDVLHPLQEVHHVLLAGLPGRDGGVAGVQRVREVVKDKLWMRGANGIFSVYIKKDILYFYKIENIEMK